MMHLPSVNAPTALLIKWILMSRISEWNCLWSHCGVYTPLQLHCHLLSHICMSWLRFLMQFSDSLLFSSQLPRLVDANFSVISGKMSIFGHSMGGHGALVCALKNPGKYKVRALFGICLIYNKQFLQPHKSCCWMTRDATLIQASDNVADVLLD